MNKLDIWKFVKNELENAGEVTILVVADSSESSPGRQGFLMAVNSTGEIKGTVGGGVLEFKMIREAQALFEKRQRSELKTLHHDPDSEGEKSGLVCGGTQTIILILLNKDDLPKVTEIIDAYKDASPKLIIIDQEGLSVTEAAELKYSAEFEIFENGEFKYFEPIGIKETVYIVGGGHVGLALSRLMKFLNFRVVVFDHRNDVFTMEQNEVADNKIITAYENVGRFIPESEYSYVVIVTAAHVGDKTALKSVINKKVKYIGTMGSKRKIKMIFDALKKEGVEEQLLEKVHSPIGLDIASETPEEIAVSIAAEIIKVKNQK